MGKQFTADFLLQVMNDNNCSRPYSLSLPLPPFSRATSSPLFITAHLSEQTLLENREGELRGEKEVFERDGAGRNKQWRELEG